MKRALFRGSTYAVRRTDEGVASQRPVIAFKNTKRINAFAHGKP